jgi:outer membrane protein OmpA-like peptidoglycan-associated protein
MHALMLIQVQMMAGMPLRQQLQYAAMMGLPPAMLQMVTKMSIEQLQAMSRMGQSIIAAAPKEGASSDDAGIGWLQAGPPPDSPSSESAKNKKARVTGDGLVVDGSLQFATDGLTMKPSSMELLGTIAACLNGPQGMTVKELEIGGHSDNRGDLDFG